MHFPFHRAHSALHPRYVAEAIATCVLTFAVGASIAGSVPLPTPVIAALVLGVFVYTIGGISGAHLNPAVTIGLASVGKIEGKEAAKYVAAQVLGALVAYGLLKWLVGTPSPAVVDTVQVAVGELIGAFLLVFGVSAVVHGRVPEAASGLVIGSSLLIGILCAATLSNGVLNPAVAIGINSLSLFYIVAPILGGLLGAQTYSWLVGR